MATMTHANLRAVADRYIEAQKRRDPVELTAYHTADGIVESPMYGTLVGRAAIEEAWRAFFKSFPDATFDVEQVLVEPPDMAVFATVTATHVNDFFGLPGTNRRIDFRGVRLMRLEGDLIARERRIYDFTGILVQVGVLRAKPAKP
jgi:C-1 hydroxylase